MLLLAISYLNFKFALLLQQRQLTDSGHTLWMSVCIMGTMESCVHCVNWLHDVIEALLKLGNLLLTAEIHL